ncbi:MAG TPA: hypothetical protein VFC41_03380 [Anaerovoracaceae bacterium]|nr:hypothetical protein [Anaerovoracaceae bacterium]
MKILKKKIILVGIIGIIGIALFFANMFQNFTSSAGTAFASGLIAISIVKLIQLYRISKSPQLLKKYEIEQKEERFILIAEKSGRFAFIFTLMAELVAILALTLLGQDTNVIIVSTIAGIQTLVYLITYFYLNKKY